MRIFILSVIAAALLSSCVKEKMITDNEGVNKWVYHTMKQEYLWSSSLDNYAPSSLSPDQYLETVRYRDNCFTALSHDYYGDRFSSISRKRAASRAVSSEDYAYDFGFSFYEYEASDGRDIAYGQVIYVVPGSPADRAGIRRGDNFNAVEVGTVKREMPLSRDELHRLMANHTVKLHMFYPEKRVVEVEKGLYLDNPVIFDSIYETAAGKTAYLVYNHFTSGQNDRFDDKLKDIFAQFKSEGARNLILDLRYNRGGELGTTVLLGSLIARESDLGKPFVYLERNVHRGKSYHDYDIKRFHSVAALGGEYNLNVDRLYIITLSSSASASEMVLHCLKPYFGEDLGHVGQKTYGKNVGSVVITNPRYEWEISLITLRAYDCNGVSGYEKGIPVDPASRSSYETGEESYLYDKGSATWFSTIGDFGEIGVKNSERMLKAVITHIDRGVWPVRARSEDVVWDGVEEKTIFPDREGGLIEERRIVF